MGSSSRRSARPPMTGARERRRKRNSAKYSRRRSGSRSSANDVATKISSSKKRCLKSANITDQRLEILSMLDFKPLYATGGKKTLAGQLFDTRITQRSAELEAVKSTLDSLQVNMPDEFTAAINQYNSALVASEGEFALLKILILLQKYSTHTPRFLKFLDEYKLPEDINIDFLSNRSTLDDLGYANGVSWGGDSSSQATLILLQTMMAVNGASVGLSPYSLRRGGRGYLVSYPDSVMYEMPFREGIGNEPVWEVASLAKDLTFSREIIKIRDDLDPDEELAELIADKLGEGWINSSIEQTDNVLSKFTGTTAFTHRFYTSLDEWKFSEVNNYVNNKAGVISTLRSGDVLIPETAKMTYGSKTYDTIDPIVEDAFSGEEVLNFDEFSEVIGNMVDELKNVNYLGRTAFRTLDKELDGGYSPRGIALVAEDQPFSCGSVAAAALEVFNRRFASAMRNSLKTPFTDWLTPEHIGYNKVLAWLLIKENPDLAYRCVYDFWRDFNKGRLTAAAQPAPVEGTAEVDSDGNEIAGTEEMSEIQHVLPGTTTVVNLAGQNTFLNYSMSKLFSYYTEDVRNMSPGDCLSKNGTENCSTPGIRVQVGKEGRYWDDYYGNTAESVESPQDLRLVNCVGLRWEGIESEGTTGEGNRWYGCKIIACEVIDAVVEVLNILISAVEPPEPVPEGDPVFPFVEGIKTPYADGPWHMSGQGFDTFQRNMWVPTLLKFQELFCRSTDKVTYLRRDDTLDYLRRIIEIFEHFMSPYGMLETRSERLLTEKVTPVNSSYAWYPTCANVRLKSGWFKTTVGGGAKIDAFAESDEPLTFYSEATGILDTLLNSDWVSIVDLPASYESSNQRTFAAHYENFLTNCHREDQIQSFLYDFVGKYAERVDGYKTAVLELVDGEGSALGGFTTTLLEIGDAGEDVLQNMSVNQLALKQVAIEEETGDPDNGYLPSLSIIKTGEANAVRALCKDNIAKSPEGDTTKIVVVGMPSGIFDSNDMDGEFSLRLSYTDIEYPQLVFRSKSYKFDKDLYVLPKDLESSTTSSSFSRVLSRMKFSRIRVEVIESDDASAQIELSDDIETERYDSGNKDIYVNLAVSEILKTYYRLLLGLNFSEIAFPSTPGGISIPMSDAVGGLAASLAENVEEISNFSEGLSSNLENLLDDITLLEDPDSYISGNITAVDDALLSDLRNAFQTRIFSPDVLRSRILSAKMFDRVYAIPVDPDEFYVVAPGEAEFGNSLPGPDPDPVETPQKIFDFYLNAGIIEETGLDAPYGYKLAPRKSAEGTMALGRITVTLTTVGDENERLWNL